MNIGFDAKRAFFNQTGLGNYSRDTIRILTENYSENQYHLFTPKTANNDRLTFFNKKNIYVQTPKKALGNIAPSIWRRWGIKSDLIQLKIDLYHGLSHELPIGIEKTNIKTIVTIHDLIFIRYPKFFKTIDRKIYFNKFKHSCKIADKIIAVSQQTKKDIIKFFDINPDKIDVVYQGCNHIFKKTIRQELKEEIRQKFHLPEKFILHVGTIEERKNLLTILKCIKELPNEKLVVIGNGSNYKKKCLQYIKEHQLEKQIIFLNELTLFEMATIYQIAEIFIYPSIFEGFGIPIIEALYSKTPVITTINGCFSEAGGPSSFYIDPLNVQEMKEAILKIKNNPILTEKQIAEGYNYVQQFNDENIAKNLMKSYLSI